MTVPFERYAGQMFALFPVTVKGVSVFFTQELQANDMMKPSSTLSKSLYSHHTGPSSYID
jgi:hypothetical protein